MIKKIINYEYLIGLETVLLILTLISILISDTIQLFPFNSSLRVGLLGIYVVTFLLFILPIRKCPFESFCGSRQLSRCRFICRKIILSRRDPLKKIFFTSFRSDLLEDFRNYFFSKSVFLYIYIPYLRTISTH